MVSLEALGLREAIATFPSDLDLDAISRVKVGTAIRLSFWEDVLDAVRVARRADLEPYVETAVLEGKRSLGLRADYRRRRTPAPRAVRPDMRRRHEPAQEAAWSDGEAAAMLSEVMTSRSWRMTAPLRKLGSRLRRPR
jgi:hypothetical protein